MDSCYNATYAVWMDFDAEIDATGLLCPLPVLRARKHLKSLASGQVLKVLADDPAAVVDFPHFCTEQGHALVPVEPQMPGVFLIRKK